MKVLVTGAAGFIGSNLVERLLITESPIEIVGLDSVNDYYDVSIKEYRLRKLDALATEYPQSKWEFVKGNLADKALIDRLFAENDFEVVVNLAAQAGVRYSITNPDAYIESNLIGFYNILEACRHSYDGGKRGVQHLVYASSSSVYGYRFQPPPRRLGIYRRSTLPPHRGYTSRVGRSFCRRTPHSQTPASARRVPPRRQGAPHPSHGKVRHKGPLTNSC